MILTVDCIWPIATLLGEGPAWCVRSSALWFTDIKGQRLHRLDPATGGQSTFAVSGQPGFVLPAADGAMIVGMDQSIDRFADGAVADRVVTIPMDPRNRLNDGTVDAHGRLWCGST